MKHRLLDGCLNPYKHHLWRLPDIPPERQPADYPGESTEMIAFIPLFQTTPNDASLEHHIVRSACWARKSWIQFTDIVDMDIPFVFYVEDKDAVLDVVFPLLEQNGIEIDKHVLLFDGTPFENVPQVHLGKKLACFNDWQFDNYDWIFQIDSDMFVASPSREKGVFFRYFRELPKVPYAANAYTHLPTCEIKSIREMHWWHKLLPEPATDTEKIKYWIETANKFTTEQVVKRYIEAHTPHPTCQGGIYAFPSKTYLNAYEKRTWLQEAGESLQDDEAVWSLWNMNGNPLQCIAQTLEIESCVNDISQIPHFSKRANPIYFAHVGNMNQEWQWREEIDAL